jgi:uncharacterized protein (TIGR03067 family)
MKKPLACLAVFGLSALLNAAAGEKTPPKIEGTWTATGGIKNGKKLPPEHFKEVTSVLVYRDGKYNEVVMGEDTEAGTYKIDATKNPPTIDFSVTAGKQKGKTQVGLFKIDGDILTLALGKYGTADRPKNLDGTDSYVLILKRNK